MPNDQDALNTAAAAANSNPAGQADPNAGAAPQNSADAASSITKPLDASAAGTIASGTQPDPKAPDAAPAAATTTVVAIPTEGTPAHETFRQELDEFLQSAERDAKEVIAWLKNHI